MAIDLQNSQNIATGWGPPPKFDAPAIGSTLSAILENRRVQQALQQKQIADAVKQIQEQRQQNAYAAALKNAGLTQGQDIGGLDSTDATHLATLIQAQTPDTARDELIKAQTRLYNAKADEPYAPSRGSGYDVPDEPETQTDSAGRVWQKTRTGWKPLAVGLQPTDVRTQNENQILKEQAGLLEQKGLMDADVAKEKSANEQLNKRDVPYSKSEQYNRMVNRLKQIQQMRTAPSTQPDAAPQPSPAETGDPLPTSKPQPTGADKNLAPGYGVPVDDVRRARARQAMDDPDATPAEKEQARRILAGG